VESETRQRADDRSPHARVDQKAGTQGSGPRARVVRKTAKRVFVVRTLNAYQETQTEWYTGSSDNRRISTEQTEQSPIFSSPCQ
jgi:hypothetical protein